MLHWNTFATNQPHFFSDTQKNTSMKSVFMGANKLFCRPVTKSMCYSGCVFYGIFSNKIILTENYALRERHNIFGKVHTTAPTYPPPLWAAMVINMLLLRWSSMSWLYKVIIHKINCDKYIHSKCFWIRSWKNGSLSSVNGSVDFAN